MAGSSLASGASGELQLDALGLTRALGGVGGGGRARQALDTAASPGLLSASLHLSTDPQVLDSGWAGGEDGPRVQRQCAPSQASARQGKLAASSPTALWRGGGLDFQRNFFGNIKHSDNFSRLRVWCIRLCPTNAVDDSTVVVLWRAHEGRGQRGG